MVVLHLFVLDAHCTSECRRSTAVAQQRIRLVAHKSTHVARDLFPSPAALDDYRY
jgi:hypothetical protein